MGLKVDGWMNGGKEGEEEAFNGPDFSLHLKI